MLETIQEQLKTHFYNHQNIKEMLENNKKKVANGKISPFVAAHQLLEIYFRNK